MSASSADKNVGNIPTLSEGYRTERTRYAIASGLLMLWGLVGFTLSKISVAQLEIVLQKAHVVPWALSVFVLYQAYMFTSEWYRSNSQENVQVISRLDLIVAHSLGIGSLLIVMFGAVSRIQAAKINFWTTVAAFFVGMTLGQLAMFSVKRKAEQTRPASKILKGFWFISILLAVTASYLEGQWIQLVAFGVGTILGVLIAQIIYWMPSDSP